MRRRDQDSDRDRDKNRGDRNRGDRNRDNRGNRRRADRVKESEKNTPYASSSTDTMTRPAVVLLKRPDSFASVTSSSTSSGHHSKESQQETKNDVQHTKESSQPSTVILRRSGPGPTLRAESFPDLRAAIDPTPSLPSAHTSSTTTTTTTTTTTDIIRPEIKIAVNPKPSSQPQIISSSSSAAVKPQPRVYSPPEHAIPFINTNDKMTVARESELDFITANTNSQDFFVITAIGKPQTGKSTILSYLIGGDKFGGKQIFKSSREKECSIYMTSNNVIYIEMASVFNGAVANDMISLMGPQGTLEIASLSWNMRIMSWAFSVSHVVLIVSEDIVDPNLFQLINSSAMVHSMDSVFGDGVIAELVYICNKASSSLLEEESVAEDAETIFNSTLARSPMITKNFYVLPHLQWKTLHYAKYEELKDRIEDFSRYNRAVFSPEIKNIKRFPQSLTLSEWLQAGIRLWDEIGQSPAFFSYVKLLP